MRCVLKKDTNSNFQRFWLCLVKKHEQQFFFVFRAPWSQVQALPPAFPGERSNSRELLYLPNGQNIFTRSGLTSGVHGGYSLAVRAGAQFRILRAGGGSNPPVCLPGRHPARLLSPFLDGPFFIHAPGGSSSPGCMRESFEQAPAISTTPESGGGTRSPSSPRKRVFANATPGKSKAGRCYADG